EAVAAAVESGAVEPEDLAATPFGEALTNAGATMGEKILVRRIGRVSGEVVSEYQHRTNKDLPPQVGVLGAADKAGAEVARDIAMHIAAFTPTYLSRDEVPEEVVAEERRIAEDTAKNEGKPEKAIPKIIEGRLNGYFKENCLLDQAFAKDNKKSVGRALEGAAGTVTGSRRFRVGNFPTPGRTLRSSPARAARARRRRPAAPPHRCGAAPVSSPRTQRGRTDMTQTFTSPIPVLPQPEDGRRVLLKLSGEAFGGGAVGVDPDVVSRIAGEIAEGVSQGVECAVVVG